MRWGRILTHLGIPAMIVWAGAGFIAWDWNAAHWPADARGMVVLLWVLLSFVGALVGAAAAKAREP